MAASTTSRSSISGWLKPMFVGSQFHAEVDVGERLRHQRPGFRQWRRTTRTEQPVPDGARAGLVEKIGALRPLTASLRHGHRTCPAGICRDGHQGWEQRATANPDRIRACWSAAPYNIGLATGPSQLLVVDLDEPGHGTKLHDRWSTLGIRTGADVFATLARRAGEELPETYTVTTPSGGTHVYFQAPATVELRNTADELGPLRPFTGSRSGP